ncbi:hypothetical protein SBADM41S_06718 [Streptomyces badius]
MSVLEIALATPHGDGDSKVLSGLLVSVLATGSIVGGLLIGAMTPELAKRATRLPVLLMSLAVFSTALAFGNKAGWLVAVPLCLLTGLSFGPSFVAVYGRSGDLAPAGMAAETQAWAGTALQLGSAAGAGAGGVLLDIWGPPGALALAPMAAVIGAASAFAGDRLRTPVAEPGGTRFRRACSGVHAEPPAGRAGHRPACPALSRSAVRPTGTAVTSGMPAARSSPRGVPCPYADTGACTSMRAEGLNFASASASSAAAVSSSATGMGARPSNRKRPDVVSSVRRVRGP